MLFMSPLRAQSVWDAAGNGNWNVAGNWNPSGVPNSDTTDVIIDNNAGQDVVVTLDISAAVRDLTVDSGDQLDMLGGRNLSVLGNLLNNGTVVVNSNAAAANTSLSFEQSTTLSGNGSLVLNRDTGFPHSVLATDTGATITHGANHTIRGTGVLSASLINNGTVSADVNGATLRLRTNDKTNNNLFLATGGGTMLIDGVAINNGSGTIRADGGTVNLETASVVGGTLETLNGGQFAATSGTSTLDGVTNQGAVNIVGGRNVHLLSSLTNNGTITVNSNSAAANTALQANGSLAIDGAGTIFLNRDTGSPHSVLATDTGATITHGVNHTIRGTGILSASLINNGTVSADVNGATLRLTSNAKTNNGTYRATGGGILLSSNGLLTNYNAGTQTLANGAYEVIGGSTMRLDGVDVQILDAHVLLDGPGSQLFNASAGSVSALAPLDTIETGGELALLNGRQLTTAGTLATQGNVNLDGATTRLTVSDDFSQTGGLTQLANGATLELLGTDNLFSGGSLAGNGTVEGSFTMGGSSVLTPGLSAGQIDMIGTFTWDGGATLEFDLGADSLSTDFLDITGDFLKDGAGAWEFSFVDNGMVVGNTIDLIGFTGTTNFDVSDFSFANSAPFDGIFAFGNGGQTLQFTLTAVPEPSSTLLVLAAGIGFGLAGGRRRRRPL